MILNIQTLRVLFTFMVVTAHLETVYAVIGLDQVIRAFDRISVDGFLVVSAFLIPYTHARRPRPPLDFVGRRLARLVPFYWAVTLAVSVLCLIAPQLFMSTVVNATTLFKSLFFIPYEKRPDIYEPIVFVGWTMTYFIFYILLHGLSLKLAGKRAWIMTTAVLSALVILGLIFKPTDAIGITFTNLRLLPLIAGLLLCTWWLHVQDRIVPSPLPKWFKPACYAAIAAGFVAVWFRDILFPGVHPRVVGTVFASLSVGAAIILNRAGVVHHSKLRDTLADASFTIYLTHFFITQATMKIVPLLGITSPLIIVPMLIATYIGVAILGVLASKWVELPLEKAVRDWWSRRMTSTKASTGAAEAS